MNYIIEINAFYNWLQGNPLSGNAQALWHRLMAYCNAFGWKEEFTLTNTRLTDDLCISRQELNRVRGTLCKCGLIVYKKGHGGKCGSYKLASISKQRDLIKQNIGTVSKNVVSDVTNKDTFDDTLSVINNDTSVVATSMIYNDTSDVTSYITYNDTSDLTTCMAYNNTSDVAYDMTGYGQHALPLNKQKKNKTKRNETKFIPPTLSEVAAYCDERNNKINPKTFFDYYEAANWTDGGGVKVKNWKQKVISWENSASYGNYKTVVKTEPSRNSGSSFDMDFINEAIMRKYQ